MNSNNQSIIALLGISAHELRILQTICQISKSRNQTYVLQDEFKLAQADILIVDQDNTDAVAAMQHFQAESPAKPVIMLTRQPGSDSSIYQLRRPLMATRLLKLLDQVSQSDERQAIVPPSQVETVQSTTTVEPQAEHKPVGDTAAIGAHLVALVVDDSLPVRQQIGHYLAPLIGRVDLVEDGEKAINFITNRSYDIIFLDVVLPGMDGYKICREIKRNKRTKKIPVIMLTGKSSPFDMVKGKLAGCDTYLTKPVDNSKFTEVVKKYLTIMRSSDSHEERDGFSSGIPGRA